MTNEKRNIAVYCRVSSDDQAENGYNLREQERRIDQYICAYADEFTEDTIKYIDDGFSAKDLNRREMIMLVQDIQDGLISKVIIHNLDRLTRSMKDLIYLIELFEKHDVQLFSLKEKIDTKTAIGRFFVSMIILIAQWEREAISERTIRAMDQSAYEGNWVHGKAPFGYDLIDKKLVINEREASIIKQVYHMFQFNNDSMSKIQHYHGNHHRDFGFVWSHDRIKNMLTNEIYTGVYKNKRIRIENHSPKIINTELFNMVQSSLEYRNRRDSHNYLYKSLCVDNNTGEFLKHKSVVKATQTYLYYENNKNTRINQEAISEQIGLHIDLYIEELIREDIKSKVSTLNRRDRRISELDYYFEIGIIDHAYYVDSKQELLENIKNKEQSIRDILSNRRRWISMSEGQKKRFLIMNVKEVKIDMKDKKIIKIIFKQRM